MQNFGQGLCANCYYRKRYKENKNYYRDRKNASGKRWREKNKGDKELWRKYKLKHKYGITLDQYKELLEKQGGVCIACGMPPFPAFNGAVSLAVDHDHKCCAGERSCGKCIRGLIHSQCNTAIGAVFDKPEVLRKLADYLEKVEKTI